MTATTQQPLPTRPRWSRLVATHRGFALDSPRDADGRLVEQPWGSAFELFTVVGAVDVDRLVGALERVVGRQLAFRGRFARRDGADVFEADVRADAARPVMTVRTLRPGDDGPDESADAWAGRVRAALLAGVNEPFRLQDDPLTRAVLVQDAPDRVRMLVAQDHSISDGWTFRLLTNAVAAQYRLPARTSPAPDPGPVDGSYFDCLDALDPPDGPATAAARARWSALVEYLGRPTVRPQIPGGRWQPITDRLQDRLSVHRFTVDEQRRLGQRAMQLGCGLADLLLAGMQLAMLAVCEQCPPVSYVYSGRRDPRTLRVMGLFCEEMLTIPVPPDDTETLDGWMTRFLAANHPRPSLGNSSVLEFHTPESADNTVAHFNFLPLRRPVRADDDVRLDVATPAEYEGLRTPAASNRFGIAVKVWDAGREGTEFTVLADHRMCPRPDLAARAMLHAALADADTGRTPMPAAVATVRALWDPTS